MKDKMFRTVSVFPNDAVKGEMILYFGHVFFFDGTVWIDCGER